MAVEKQQSPEHHNNTTFILFASGDLSEVQVTPHAPKPNGNRPADGYVVAGGGLNRSARLAAEAVYNCLQQTTHTPGHFVAGFDVQGADGSMAGESAGLAFALALARHSMFCPGDRPSVAATGALSGGSFPGPVERVDGINEKLGAAAKVLKSGDLLFFPAANEQEIAPEIKKMLNNQGVLLYPVSSVAGALEFVFDVKPSDEKDKKKKYRAKYRKMVLVTLLLPFLLIYPQFTMKKTVKSPEQHFITPAPVPAPVLPTMETISHLSLVGKDTPGQDSGQGKSTQIAALDPNNSTVEIRSTSLNVGDEQGQQNEQKPSISWSNGSSRLKNQFSHLSNYGFGNEILEEIQQDLSASNHQTAEQMQEVQHDRLEKREHQDTHGFD